MIYNLFFFIVLAALAGIGIAILVLIAKILLAIG